MEQLKALDEHHSHERTKGEEVKHILFDLEGCDADLLDDYRFVRNTLFHAAILSNSRILKIDFHQFTPQGVTGFALLADSHISIHT